MAPTSSLIVTIIVEAVAAGETVHNPCPAPSGGVPPPLKGVCHLAALLVPSTPMYWPDYNLRPRRKSRWGLAIALGLLVGLLGVVLLQDWWQILLPANNVDATSVPAPLAAAVTPRTAGDVAGATPGTEGTPPAAGQTLALDEPAPAFILPDLFEENTTYTLAGNRGRPVILNFWASWCVPCRREMPALQATAARYEADGLLLLGMNQTYLDDVAAARAFVEELDLTFPNTRDDSGAVGSGAYQIVGIPTTVFITPAGEVAHIQIGEMSLEQITTFTDRLIAGQPLAP